LEKTLKSFKPLASILILEDNLLTLNLIVSFFADTKYKVSKASNGLDGLNLLKENKFDLVITDMYMPHVDGTDLIKWLRKNQPEIKIIAISSGTESGNSDYLREALLNGADDIMAKPLDKESLLQFTTRLLAPSHASLANPNRQNSLLILDKEKTVLRSLRHYFNLSPFCETHTLETRSLALGLSKWAQPENIQGCLVDQALLKEFCSEWNKATQKPLPPFILSYKDEVLSQSELTLPSLVAYLKKPLTPNDSHHAFQLLLGSTNDIGP